MLACWLSLQIRIFNPFAASLVTYGFRGEALASLCAVAEVSITTKTKESMVGHTYTLDHSGNISTKKPAAASNGIAN